MDHRNLHIAAAVAVVGTAGALSVATAPAGSLSGYLWPTGLATGVLLWGTRRQGPVLTGLLFVVAALTFVPGDYWLAVALPFAAVIAAEAWLVDRLIPRHSDGEAWLLTTSDVARYAIAAAAGATLGAVGFTLTSALTGHGVPWEIGLAVLTRHLASQLIVVPLFLKILPRVLKPPPSRERVVRWGLTLAVTCLALIPTTLPSLLFLVLPLLSWSAVRATVRENQWLVAAVAAIAAISADLGYGPFNSLSSRFGNSAELALLPMHAFLIACALISIPFALAVRQQRVATREAAAERSRNGNLVNAAQGLLIVGTDDLGRINLFNTGAERILGYTADEVMGESPEMFHTHEEIARLARVLGCKPTFLDVIAAFLARETPTPMDWEFVRKDGEKRILAFLLTPMYDADHQLLGFLASADDLTDRVRTQAALERALTRALAAESDAVSRLAQVDRAKDSFVSAVSHELRTPITNLVGYLELLRDRSYGDLTVGQDQALARIELNSRRLLTLIDDLLTLARIEEPKFAAGRIPLDLREVVQRTATEMRHVAESHGLRLSADVPDVPVLVSGDASQLGRLLANLADNATKFTPFGGTITLRLFAEDGTARLDVADTGVGIPPDEQGQVFQRFFRTTSAEDDATPGTGLGLFIAKAIVDAHGARIGLDSQPGQGTTFSVWFPQAEAPASSIATA